MSECSIGRDHQAQNRNFIVICIRYLRIHTAMNRTASSPTAIQRAIIKSCPEPCSPLRYLLRRLCYAASHVILGRRNLRRVSMITSPTAVKKWKEKKERITLGAIGRGKKSTIITHHSHPPHPHFHTQQPVPTPSHPPSLSP